MFIKFARPSYLRLFTLTGFRWPTMSQALQSNSCDVGKPLCMRPCTCRRCRSSQLLWSEFVLFSAVAISA